MVKDTSEALGPRVLRRSRIGIPTLLHPNSIAVAIVIFGPSEVEISWAHYSIAAHETALSEGKGVTLVDGQLVEALHVEEAQRLVRMAKTIEEIEEASN